MEELKSVCTNPWCKAPFFYKEQDMIVVQQDRRKSNLDEVLNEVEKVAPKKCHKCRSLESEMSGGVEWKTKEFEGSRYDGMPHEIKYKVTNYRL